MTSYDIIVAHLRKTHDLHEEWDAFKFEHLHNEPIPGKPYTPQLFGTKFTGAVAPRFVRGKKKGWRNWSKMEKSTVGSFILTPAEVDIIYKTWEKETYKCSKCCGYGIRITGWSKAEGDRHSTCKACSGTGEAQVSANAQN